MGKKSKSKKSSTNKNGARSDRDNGGPVDPPAHVSRKSERSSKNKRSAKDRGSSRSAPYYKQQHTDEDVEFRKSLQASGRYSILEIAADGNCLFRSLSDQLFGDYGNKYHADVRSAVCDFMEQHKDDFSVFLVLDDDDAKDEEDAADFESYVKQMRQDGEWGGNLELVAAARLYRRNITVFSSGAGAAMNIPHGCKKKSSGADLLLSYHDNDHYSSVHDASQEIQPMDPPEQARTESGNVRVTVHNGKHKNGALHMNGSDETSETQDVESPLEPEGRTCSGEDISVEAVIEEDPPILPEKDDATIERNLKESNKPPRKNQPCHCGSGKRYKKCCWTAERHKQRLQKLKRQESDDASTTAVTVEEDDIGKERAHDVEMNGHFRVLHI